jgi:predicted DNA-binding transcriptional regulator AlpA
VKLDLVGLAEIAEMLKVSTRRVDVLSRQRDFPEPVASLIGGRVWLRADVQEWADKTGRVKISD